MDIASLLTDVLREATGPTAIAYAQQGVEPARPLTHDLMVTVFRDLGHTLEAVHITELRQNTFIAELHFDGGKTVISARPSDAIALALRAQAPIFVEEKVIDHAKTVDLTPDKGETERLQKWLENLDPDDMGKYKM